MLILLVPLLPLIAIFYVTYQTHAIVRLVRLLTQSAHIAQVGLASNVVWGLCYLPGSVMFLLIFCYVAVSPDEVGLFGPVGAAMSAGFWLGMTLWLRSIVRHDLAIYREPTALVPAVVLALICLTYVAVLVGAMALEAVTWQTFGGGNMMWLAGYLLLLFIPGAPLAGLVLLIVHVGRVRAAHTWETYVPPEEDEIP